MSLHDLPIGEHAPEAVNAVVEIPRGSQNKYEFDEALGVVKLDRVLHSPVHYPLDYGFIPETRSPDGDHLDVLIIGNGGDPVFSGCMVEVRPLGLLKMIDDGEEDFKILGAQVKNPRLAELRDLKDVEVYNGHLLKEIAHFFSVMKELEGKKVEILGWEGASAAKEEITKAQQAYKV